MQNSLRDDSTIVFLDKIALLETELLAERHNSFTNVSQNSTEEKILFDEISTIDDRMSKMEELFRTLAPSPSSDKHNIFPPKPQPPPPPLVIIDPSIVALIASQQSIMTIHMMKIDTLLQTLGETITALKVSQSNQVVASNNQLL